MCTSVSLCHQGWAVAAWKKKAEESRGRLEAGISNIFPTGSGQQASAAPEGVCGGWLALLSSRLPGAGDQLCPGASCGCPLSAPFRLCFLLLWRAGQAACGFLAVEELSLCLPRLPGVAASFSGLDGRRPQLSLDLAELRATQRSSFIQFPTALSHGILQGWASTTPSPQPESVNQPLG